jgi:hypothetical protein
MQRLVRPAGDHLSVAACHLFSLCSNRAMSDHPASWRMPSPKQMEKLASGRLRTPQSDDPAPDSTFTGMPSYGTPAPPGSHGFPSSRCACRRFRANCFGSNALDAPVVSRYSASMRSSSMGRMRPGRTLVSGCSTTAARSGQDATKRTAVGRIGCVEACIQ